MRFSYKPEIYSCKTCGKELSNVGQKTKRKEYCSYVCWVMFNHVKSKKVLT